VAVGLPDGKVLDEFDIDHSAGGFNEFFRRVETIEKRHQLPVAVAMEGYNGWAQRRGVSSNIPTSIVVCASRSMFWVSGCPRQSNIRAKRTLLHSGVAMMAR